MKQTKILLSINAILALASTFLYTTNIYAEENTILEPIIVTPAKIEQKLSNTLLPVSSINLNSALKNTNNNALTDVLKQQLGLEIKQTGGLGGQTSIFARSSGSNQNLVTLDGVPINSLSTGAATIERLNINNFSRAESILGSVSSIYGSNAMGGVLNLSTAPLVTTKESELNGNVRLKYGSENTLGLNTSLAGQYYNQSNDSLTSYGLKLSSIKTNGIDAMDKAVNKNSNIDKDGYEQKGIGLYLQHQQGMNTLSLTAGHNNTKAEYDSNWDKPTDTHEYKSKFNNIGLNINSKINTKLTSKFVFGYNQEDSKDYKNDIEISAYKNTNKYASGQLDYIFLPENTLSLQAEKLWQNIDSNSLYSSIAKGDKFVDFSQDKRKTDSFRLGYIGQINDMHSLQANIRHDKVSDIKSAMTYLFGYGLNITPEWKLFATYATGFRTPTFNDLYGSYNSNPLLKPEYSKNIEAGSQYTKNGLIWRTSLYKNKYEDLIGYDANYMPININKAKISGLESKVNLDLGKLKLNSGFNWQNPQQIDILANGDEKVSTLLLRAKLFGNIGASYLFTPAGKSLIIGGNVQFTAPKTDYGNKKLAGYALVDLNANYSITPELYFQLGVKNLFNRETHDVYGYNKPKRQAFIQLSYSPKLK